MLSMFKLRLYKHLSLIVQYLNLSLNLTHHKMSKTLHLSSCQQMYSETNTHTQVHTYI